MTFELVLLYFRLVKREFRQILKNLGKFKDCVKLLDFREKMYKLELRSLTKKYLNLSALSAFTQTPLFDLKIYD